MTEPYLIPQNELPEKYISIHTSDRNTYRRCRRKWDFVSGLRQHLEPTQINIKFFVGKGFHFSLEDYHGYNRFGHPAKAFQAYYNAYNEVAKEQETEDYMSIDYEEATEFIPGLFDHYLNEWLPMRNQWETLWIDDKPMLEVEFSIYIPELSEYMKMPVIYQGKFDGVRKDQIGRSWIVEFKTASAFEVDKLQTDPQVSNYSWASQFVLPEPAFGVLFIQFKKDYPKIPRELKNGHISTAKDQKTTAKMLKVALNEKYGLIPTKYNDAIKALMEKETDNGDSFIRYDYVIRNAHHRANEYPKILAEGYEMLNKNLVIYPNPTSDCSWDCDFRQPCLALDGGSDWQFMIKENYQIKKEGKESWELKIRYPK